MFLGRTPIEFFLGPLLLGLVLSFVAYGFLVMQVCQVFQFAKRCFPLATNTVILLIVLLESLCAGLAMGWIYITFILDFGKPNAIQDVSWLLWVISCASALVISLAQLLYAHRLVRFLQCTLAAIAVWALSLPELAFTLFTVVRLVRAGTLAGLDTHHSAQITYFAYMFFTDAAISNILLWCHTHTPRVPVSSCWSSLVVHSALAGPICSAAQLALSAATPTLGLVAGALRSKAYAISLLAMLNWGTPVSSKGMRSGDISPECTMPRASGASALSSGSGSSSSTGVSSDAPSIHAIPIVLEGAGDRSGNAKLPLMLPRVFAAGPGPLDVDTDARALPWAACGFDLGYDVDPDATGNSASDADAELAAVRRGPVLIRHSSTPWARDSTDATVPVDARGSAESAASAAARGWWPRRLSPPAVGTFALPACVQAEGVPLQHRMSDLFAGWSWRTAGRRGSVEAAGCDASGAGSGRSSSRGHAI